VQVRADRYELMAHMLESDRWPAHAVLALDLDAPRLCPRDRQLNPLLHFRALNTRRLHRQGAMASLVLPATAARARFVSPDLLGHPTLSKWSRRDVQPHSAARRGWRADRTMRRTAASVSPPLPPAPF